MREILDDVISWVRDGKRAAIATVIAVERSAPRGPGAALAVNEDGVVTGSVSGGCVEPAVFEEARLALETGEAKKLTYGISDDQAFEVGLTCGGTVHLIVFPVGEEALSILDGLNAALEDERTAALATVLDGPYAGSLMLVGADGITGSLHSPGLEHAVSEDAIGMTEVGETGILRYGPDGERRPDDVSVFIHSFSPRPQLYVFGAIDFAGAVCKIGRFLNYRVTLCDARQTFATKERFPDADEIVVRWPHEFLVDAEVDKRTVICVLTHDPKFDIPVLLHALTTPAAYIGAMGSRRTDEERRRELRERGVSEQDLQRISSPIGLDIGSTTPEEVAVSIAAEIIAVRHNASGGRLANHSGPIHKHRVTQTP